ncbi:hypothetical protein [Streptacidiphilus carbonis]|uniref:hypothetical protein n=1 Tax=Streptacidiphilus carbonis TaxID=105422 RepID=UPI000693A60D|nr:hypothetical protein [Streptacidiphilus carbonis]
MRDEDAELWERQFDDTDADSWALLPGADCTAGSWWARAAAARLNDALAECGFEIWEIEAAGSVTADGRGLVRVVGSPLAVRRLVRMLELLGPSGDADWRRGAA